MPLALRLCMLLGFFGLLVGQLVNAQEVITVDSARVALPSADWAKTEPPTAVRKASQNHPELKLLVYARSPKSNLRLHITQFDYPEGVTDGQLAAFIDGVQKRYEIGAVGPVYEVNKKVADTPVIELDARYRGWAFTSARAYFYGKRVYLVEVGGPSDFRPEAVRCWDGFSIVGEPPLGAETFARVVDLRKREVPKIVSSHARAQAGYYALIVLTGIAVAIGILAVAIRVAWMIRMRMAQPGHWDQPDE